MDFRKLAKTQAKQYESDMDLRDQKNTYEDFMRGYRKALFDTKAEEMLEILIKIKDKLANSDIPDYDDYEDLEKLINSINKTDL